MRRRPTARSPSWCSSPRRPRRRPSRARCRRSRARRSSVGDAPAHLATVDGRRASRRAARTDGAQGIASRRDQGGNRQSWARATTSIRLAAGRRPPPALPPERDPPPPPSLPALARIIVRAGMARRPVVDDVPALAARASVRCYRRDGPLTASYLAVMRVRPARRLLYALTAACLSFGMVGLTLLLTVERLTGSYPDGGFAVSLFALAAGASAPMRGRLVDRRGARRWLPGLAAAYAVSLCAIDLLARLDGPLWSLLALAACVGATTPPLFSSARAVWPQAVEPHLLRRG